MPEKETLARAQRARRSGKAPSTQASEFVREEMHHIREGKHGAPSTKQAIAIGLSKARRAGVRLKPPAKGETSEKTRHSAERAYEAGAHPQKRTSRKRSEAAETALQHEGHSAASHRALSTQARRGWRFSALLDARERVAFGFAWRLPFAVSRLACARTFFDARFGVPSATPERRAFERPIAIACFVFAAPCLP